MKNLFIDSSISIEKLDSLEKKDIISQEVQNINSSISSENNVDNTINEVNATSNTTTLNSEAECLKKLQNPRSIIEYKRILFKIDKSKFQYPFLKDTELTTYLNLPIVRNVQYIQEKNQETYTINIGECPYAKGYYTINYTSISAKLLIDFSVALYKQKTETENCPYDINNLDIYGFDSDSFLAKPFKFCYTGDTLNITPSDFSVELTTITPVVRPVCEFDNYYLYEVDVNILISLLPNIILNYTDEKTLEALNKPVGNTDLTNREFSRDQLASIHELDLSSNPELTYEVFPYLINLNKLDVSNNPNLNFNIFQYLGNLVELNISNTTSDPIKLNNLAYLYNLKILIARDNNITNYEPFRDLVTLIELYLDNGLPSSTSFTTFQVSQSVDIAPLTNLVNLEVLSLYNNNITIIPESISNLVNLKILNLGNNNIVDVSNLSLLPSLDKLILEGNPIDPKTVSNLSITELDLSNTGLTNDGLRDITISINLLKLNISNNKLSNLSTLYGYNNLTVIATSQTIDSGTIYPDEDGMFILDLSFLKDIDSSTPGITEISNNGSYCDDESCYEPSIIWENINSLTNASFKFANNSNSFTGIVNVILNPTIIYDL